MHDDDAIGLDFPTLRAAYRVGALTPEGVVRAVYGRIARRGDDAVWIDLVPEGEALARARALGATPGPAQPLFGLPFAIKDNIDLAGRPTTAACPVFAYTPARSAPAVERLLAAGAIPIGKTNLDQFATGLVGTRSPYGAPSSALHADYVSGGSSSGSAVAVAAGLVSFALGTDTAGSGRVPAAFNNVVGLKPTRGSVSTVGVVPACRSLDCVSVFALTCDDAFDVLTVMQGADPADPYARATAPLVPVAPPATFRFGVPDEGDLRFCGDTESERLYRAALDRLAALGGTRVVIDYAPFAEAAELLYGGPWVAERLAPLVSFLKAHPDALHPVTARVLADAERHSAVDAFRAQHRLAALRAATASVWRTIDLLALPTAPTIFRHAEVAAAPLARNADLGTYTNFVNLLDCAAVAVPAGIDTRGLPAGITLVGPAESDALLVAIGDVLHRSAELPMGATGRALPPPSDRAAPSRGLPIAVVGAHLSGMPLNGELVQRGARLLRATTTAARYRLYALDGAVPPKPGLVRVHEEGAAIAVEVWDVPMAEVGGFLAGIGAPLALGRLELADGSWVTGFVCETWGLTRAIDITAYGGWKAYRAAGH